MKIHSLYLAVVLLVLCTLHAAAQDEHVDTVSFYNTWEQILYDEPVAIFSGSNMMEVSIYDVSFMVVEPDVQQIMNDAMAAKLDDNTWLINTRYLMRNFKGVDYPDREYVPLIFSDKMAFIEMYTYLPDVRIEEYYIDFKNRELLRLDRKLLVKLLGDYHDLQMRYESMKDYKTRPRIKDYFMQYIERVTADPLRPSILEMVAQWDQ